MHVAVAHAAAEEDSRVFQQRAVAVGKRLQPVQELAEQLRIVGLKLGEGDELLGLVAVVRQRVMRLADAHLRVDALAGFPAHHERHDPGDVRFVRDRKQVEHQRRVFLE